MNRRTLRSVNRHSRLRVRPSTQKPTYFELQNQDGKIVAYISKDALFDADGNYFQESLTG